MSCSPLTRASSLSNELGYFYPSYEELAENTDIKHAIEGIKQEYRAQIQRILDFGVQPTHVETHMTPEHQWEEDDTFKPIVQAAEEVAAEFGLIYTYAFKNGKSKYFNDSFTLTHLNFEQTTERLASYGDGIYHLVCHCALNNEEQNALALPHEPAYSWAAKCRQTDLDIVSSLEFKTFLEENQFTLINITQLLELHGLNN
ncbi:ChbG/HpnK family deacetylase [Vibrio mexicanus]|uniref:ChbG/HpnK family deacetylase n=1 Tax=Vibrio mexicanus TaxID=1004326 RepID=UPI0009496881|nr:ChbG/HpnK family deacetylase [Vibrio mexicanus]